MIASRAEGRVEGLISISIRTIFSYKYADAYEESTLEPSKEVAAGVDDRRISRHALCWVMAVFDEI